MDYSKTEKTDNAKGGKEKNAGRETPRLRVGITQGDANGVGFEMIFKTFMEPEMLELCTPVIYGSPKIASYHSKTLELHCPFSIINKIEDVRDDRLNLLVSYDEDVKVEFGKRCDVSALPAVKSLAAAAGDCKKGLIDVVVCGPVDRRTVEVPEEGEVNTADYIYSLGGGMDQTLRLYQNGIVRMGVLCLGGIRDVLEAFTAENVGRKLRSLHTTLRRDFRIDNPRIAVLGLGLDAGSADNTLLSGVVAELAAGDVQVFGPYMSDKFFARRDYEAFDAVLAMYPEQALLPMRMLSDDVSVVVHTALPFVCTAPMCDAQLQLAGRGEADETLLRHAVYDAMDMFAARRDYDEAFANPLKKLYREHSDNGEKPYFAPPKKTDTNNG